MQRGSERKKQGSQIGSAARREAHRAPRATRPLRGGESRVVLPQVVLCPTPLARGRAEGRRPWKQGAALSYRSALAHFELEGSVAWFATPA